MRGLIRALAGLLLAAAFVAAHAADRVALLIGNNTYAATPLRNAVNDARDLGEALKDLGFRVIVRENATRKDMIDAIREFGSALDGASAAVFFYAGHAMQFKDRNYLIPIDAAMGSEEDVTFFSVEVSQVFDRMDRARTRFNFLILDACRDNPFASSFKTTSAGLAQMSAPSGTLIAYATAPGSVAADGFQRNGVYTKHILQNIKVPDLPVEIMFKRVREGVERETRKLQTPWDSSSLKGDFAFNATGRLAAATAAGPSADATLQIEREFWVSVRDSNRADDIQAYLDKYPNGNFAPLARNRLDGLLRPGRAAAPPREAAPSKASPDAVVASRSADPSPPELPSAPKAAAPAETTPAARATGEPLKAEIAKPELAKHESAKPETTKPESKPAAAVVAAAAATAKESPAIAPQGAAAGPPAPSADKPPAINLPGVAARPEPPQPGREIAPGVREVAFADGAIYRGALRGSSLHGRGEYVSKAFRYQGEFVDGLKEGQGVYTWENGDRYEGRFAQDRPDGRGRYQFSNGDIYEGEVKEGVIRGRGTYTAKNGDVFEGSFQHGRPDGVGVYRFATGDRYEGEMSQGVPQGKGRYVSRNGDRVEGTFEAGRPHGHGTYHFANGDRYEGELRHGDITGVGVYHYGAGPRYEGEMRGGQPGGRGTFWFLDGSRFEGTFEGGLKRATGEVVDRDGNRRPAEIIEGSTRFLN